MVSLGFAKRRKKKKKKTREGSNTGVRDFGLGWGGDGGWGIYI